MRGLACASIVFLDASKTWDGRHKPAMTASELVITGGAFCLETAFLRKDAETTPASGAFLNPIFAAALAALIDIEEEILQPWPFLDQALFVRVTDQSSRTLRFLSSVRIPTGRDPECAPAPPRHRDTRRAARCAGSPCASWRCFCIVERLEQVDREPWMLVRERLTEAENVHDRKNTGALK